MAIKIGCIIQGDIRRGTGFILEHLPAQFDYTVLSTWMDGKVAPNSNFDVIRSHKPVAAGSSNRNYQRYSTARGLEAAKAAGCDYVLKWRTDMLPSKLSTKLLLEWAQFSPPKEAQSRIVVPAFRNLSVTPDCFSSMPDLFAFGHIAEMEKLWGDEGFDYSKDFNLPQREKEALPQEILSSNKFTGLYCPEAELYTLYRDKLNSANLRNPSHKYVAENYLRLFNYQDFEILWFGANHGFRSVGAAWQHPWWTEKQWQNKSAKIQPFGYPSSGLIGKLRRKISDHKIRQELNEQQRIWERNFSNQTLT
jgi:hypothetical protein